MTLLEYRYEGRFDYPTFAETVAPTLTEFIVYPTDEDYIPSPNEETLALRKGEGVDYIYEVYEMLDRMGVPKYDGLSGVNRIFECTYIEGLSATIREDCTEFARFPLSVSAAIWVAPK